MRPHEVRNALLLLNDNPYGAFYHGPPTVVVNPLFAQACVRAEWFLGYRHKKLSGQYGQKLRAYLLGTKRLPLFNRYRRWRRLKLMLPPGLDTCPGCGGLNEPLIIVVEKDERITAES